MTRQSVGDNTSGIWKMLQSDCHTLLDDRRHAHLKNPFVHFMVPYLQGTADSSSTSTRSRSCNGAMKEPSAEGSMGCKAEATASAPHSEAHATTPTSSTGRQHTSRAPEEQLPQRDQSEGGDATLGRDGISTSSWQVTTIQCYGIPPAFTLDQLRQVLDATGFQGRYNYAHIPRDMVSYDHFGYAFINFVDEESASAMVQMWDKQPLLLADQSW
eukprot:CAMPEP_0178418474 /NCGR_PEP_ID=MMETSP0689_2-20121128/25105_1 /TAXON_ID=160604 /ORGANISM="Amphidinium massartii, Strain CS-259" /LENGTH=213 /DNA_ID=CAMNT_0020039865 /DNA_START=46 /DNA_END=684 /DNA_ORIENTATION=-